MYRKKLIKTGVTLILLKYNNMIIYEESWIQYKLEYLKRGKFFFPWCHFISLALKVSLIQKFFLMISKNIQSVKILEQLQKFIFLREIFQKFFIFRVTIFVITRKLKNFYYHENFWWGFPGRETQKILHELKKNLSFFWVTKLFVYMKGIKMTINFN